MPTLFLWGALDAVPAEDHAGWALPSLDPPSLYAASLLRLLPSSSSSTSTPSSLTLSAPSPMLHGIVPRLEFDDVHAIGQPARTDALEGIAPIEAYARTPSAAQHRPSVDLALAPNPLLAAHAEALHAVIATELEPLTLHALFSNTDNFVALAQPTYAYSHPPPSSSAARRRTSALDKVGNALEAPFHIRPRLRAGVQAHLTRHGLWGLAGSAKDELEREARKKKDRRLGKEQDGAEHEGPARVRLSGKSEEEGVGMLSASSRKEMDIGWDKTKLTARAQPALDILNAALSSPSGEGEEHTYLLGTAQPTSLDAHLFSVLAPLLFHAPLGKAGASAGVSEGTNTTSTDKASTKQPEKGLTMPVATLLRRRYPALVRHTARVGSLLWAVERQVDTTVAAPINDDEAEKTLGTDTSGSETGSWTWTWTWRAHNDTPLHIARTYLLFPAASSASAGGSPSTGAGTSSTSALSPRVIGAYLLSSARSAPRSAWSSLRTSLGWGARSRSHSRRAAATDEGFPSGSEGGMLRPAPLGWGRALWISSALVGFVSFLFVSGLVAIEIVEEGGGGEGGKEDGDEMDGEEEEEGEGNEDEEEEEDGNDEREVDQEGVLVEEGEAAEHEHDQELFESGDMYLGDDGFDVDVDDDDD